MQPPVLQTEFAERIAVGIADWAASNNPNVVLATAPLGACLGVSVYDPVVQAGGLMQVVLPHSRLDLDKASVQPAMFVDTGLTALLRAVYRLGAAKTRVQICVAGGAWINDQSGHLNIGRQNYEALAQMMTELQFTICAEHVGGQSNRSMQLDLATGTVRIKVLGPTSEVWLWKN